MIFTSEIVEKLKDQAQRSVINTFDIMFNKRVNLNPKSGEGVGAKGVSAYIEIRDKESKAIIQICLSEETADSMFQAIATDIPADKAVRQDAACELANIVGYSMRTSLQNEGDFDLNLSLPMAGEPDRSPNTTLSGMHFSNKSHDAVDVTLICPTAA